MFKRMIKAVILSAAIALGGVGAVAGLAATSDTAAAQSATFEFRFGGGHAPRYHHGPRYGRPHYGRNFCDPRHAVHKASRMGVHRAHVVRNAPRRVAVRGFRHGHPIRVVFANQRGCPVIAYR